MNIKYFFWVILVAGLVILHVGCEKISTTCIHSYGKSCTCDSAEMITSTSASLKSSMVSLQASLDSLVKQFNITVGQLASTITGINQGDTFVLSSTDLLLSKTKAELALFFGAANAEVSQLQQTLRESDHNFTVCNDLERYNETVSNLPYVTHYCGFENYRLCNYTREGCYNKHAECWYQGTGRQNTHSGPIEDHTFGTPHGHYLYIDPMKQPTWVQNPLHVENPRNRTAALLTTVLPPGPQYCVRFWYTMYGHYVMTLTVYVQDADRFFLNTTQVYQLSGQEDKYWHMAEIPLKPRETKRAFKVVIKATTNSYRHSYSYHAYGYIAIDDIYVYNTSCISIPKCPVGSQQFTDGNQTSCYTFHKSQVTWYDAVKTCKSEAPNGHLVSINSKKEEDFLIQVVSTITYLSTWFTSGNDERIEGQFKWTDTGYPYSLNYTNWLPGQPDDVNNTQQCLAIERSRNGYQWNDVTCDTKLSYICEIHL